MAGDWIKIRKDLITDPDVVNIATLCGLDEFGVAGRLISVWSWLDTHSVDGRRVPIADPFLDRLTGLAGFAAAMRRVGWLTGNAGSLTFPDYEKHNGKTAKNRAVEAKKKAFTRGKGCDRDGDKCPDGRGTNVPMAAGPEKRREEKSTIPTQHWRTPTLAEALAYFVDRKAPYAEQQIREAWNSLEATKAPAGHWWWGSKPVTDWRFALEARIESRGEKNGNNSKRSDGVSDGKSRKIEQGIRVKELS